MSHFTGYDIILVSLSHSLQIQLFAFSVSYRTGFQLKLIDFWKYLQSETVEGSL